MHMCVNVYISFVYINVVLDFYKIVIVFLFSM